MRILVADDDPVSRRMMQGLLQRSGYDVTVAENGSEALDILLAPDSPRLALLDWVMPGLDGPEVCRRIRALQGVPYIYITLLTSKVSDSDVVAGLEAGADDYLTKPCNVDELKARLRTGQRILRLEDTLVEAREEMRFKADHDALTGLWNHGAILRILERELEAVSVSHTPVSVLLCDVDHFKQVNDSYGHLIGDEVLRRVAARLLEVTGPDDSVGRYGGEEFLILLRDCCGASIKERAERVREAIAHGSFPIVKGSLAMTISVGAVAVPDWDARFPVEALLKEVDAALYLAKAAGRNRVVCAELVPPKVQ